MTFHVGDGIDVVLAGDPLGNQEKLGSALIDDSQVEDDPLLQLRVVPKVMGLSIQSFAGQSYAGL